MIKQLGKYILIIIFCVSASSLFSQNTISKNNSVCITKPISYDVPNFSGDKQHQSTSLKIEKPIRVLVKKNDSVLLVNYPVYFEFGDTPNNSKGHKIYNSIAYTDSNGIASTFVKLGTKKGEYEVIVTTNDTLHENVLVYNLFARKSNWILMLVIGLLGGLGLFLFGINMLSDSMQKSAGDKMRSILGRLTKNRFIGVGVGAFVTMITQSSSATTVMLVSFVESRLMRFSQTLGLILGAAIGTTVTVQLIAFKITDYALLMIAVGFLVQLISKSQKIKYLGQTILGFGILFFGMYVMSEAMYPLRSYDPFIEVLLKLQNPVFGIVVGLVFTALIQSSGAFIGIMIILSSQGFLSLEASIPLILGSNVGTAITAILASINTSREAKKVAIAHTLFKIVGVLIFVWWIPYFAEFVEIVSPKGNSSLDELSRIADVVPRQIANTHTIFNIAITLAFLPFTRIIAKLIHKILPSKIKREEKFKLKYLNQGMIQTPALALNLAKQEALRMGQIVQDMLNDIVLPFFTKEKNILTDIEEKEKNVNFLRDEIKEYLIKISRENIPQRRVDEAFQIMYAIKEFERIADIISKTLYRKAKLWVENGEEFTGEGKKEIMEYHLKTQKQISRSLEVFRDLNLEKAKAMKLKYKKYRAIAYDLERQHYERIKEDIPKSAASSKIHLELIGMFREISSHATNIARIMIEWTKE